MTVLVALDQPVEVEGVRVALGGGSSDCCEIVVCEDVESLLRLSQSLGTGDLSSSDCLERSVVVVDWEWVSSPDGAIAQSVLEQLSRLPVVVVLDKHQREQGRQAIQWGAQDYVCRHELHGEHESSAETITRVLENAIERHQQRETLREKQNQSAHQESFLRSVVESSPTLIAVKDRAGKYVVANSALASLYGVTPLAMMGHREVEINSNQAQAHIHEREEGKVLEDGQQRETPQEPYQDAWGQLRWFYSVRRPLLNHQGQAEWVLVVMTDVTARQVAEQALWDQVERVRLLGQITQALRRSLHLSEILETTVKQVRQFLTVDRVMVYQLPGRGEPGELKAIDVATDRELQGEDGAFLLSLYEGWSWNQGQVQGGETYGVAGFETQLSLTQAVERWWAMEETQGETQEETAATSATPAKSLEILQRLLSLEVRSLLVVPIFAGTYVQRDAQGETLVADPLPVDLPAVEPLSELSLPMLDVVEPSEDSPENVARQGAWGLLVAHQCGEERPWPQWEREFLRHLSEQLAIAIQQATLYDRLGQVNRKLEHLATLDGLTGIPNRRLFDQVLQQEWERSRRSRQPLALMVADIDFFKAYNDNYGHLAGDACLRRVARILAKVVKRSTDLAFRYGGEEFAIILPNTQLPGAITIAQQVLNALWAAALEHDYSTVAPQVTLSLGLTAMVPGLHQQPGNLIQRADQALFIAKEAGRNRAIVLGPHSNDSTPVTALYPHPQSHREGKTLS